MEFAIFFCDNGLL